MNALNTKEIETFESGMNEYMESQINGKADRKPVKGNQTQSKAKYIPKAKRTYKSDTEFSSTISTHYRRNLTDSQRTTENARLRETMSSGKVKTSTIAIDLDSKEIKSLFAGKADYSKKSQYDRLLTKIVNILLKKGCNKKAVYTFPYFHKDTKEGNVVSLARRVRTACKPYHIRDERTECKETEIHKILSIASKKQINSLRYADEEITAI